ncbi:MarR family winged helix-turn-helix transcriptional regulator [Azohydromonas sediminis]|uniref:MarR family winged helix-turn-helix transcriptional regulator n=1 Tax=Azohydromonas sediminis TaxID=2259674 RepID=UPI000E657238|nr:MarR family winged helix-turn-helix transcriptional regulator [Azohydromonas sediminis]
MPLSNSVVAGTLPTGAKPDPRTATNLPATGLYASPEYLIRRAHQIMSAAFVDACADLELTPSQYAALFALRQRGSVSQNELGRLIALDRSTTSVVVKSLRERALVRASEDPLDKRKTVLSLEDAGRLLLVRAEKRSARAGDVLVEALGAEKTRLLLELLHELTNHHRSG